MKKLFLALLIIATLFMAYKVAVPLTTGVIGAMDKEQDE